MKHIFGETKAKDQDMRAKFQAFMEEPMPILARP